jgi:hypothetical protein
VIDTAGGEAVRARQTIALFVPNNKLLPTVT